MSDYKSKDKPNPALNENKTIEVIQNILSQNDTQANALRASFNERGILALNLMSSPGAGKTTLLESTIKACKNKSLKIGVVEGDLETNRDADRIIKAGACAHQITTGQSCHLDAFMVGLGLEHLPLNDLNVVFIENVGNLVCPASYDVGAHLNIVLLSVPEGSDKVAKYPVMFRRADLVLVTKYSLLEHFDFSIDEVKDQLARLNPQAKILALDAKNGENFNAWMDFLFENFKKIAQKGF